MSDVVAYFIKQGEEFLARGNKVEAEKCFKCAEIAAAESAEHSLSYAKVDTRKLIATHRINQVINPAELVHRPNTLECICLLASGPELQNGQFESFVERLAVSLQTNPVDAALAKQLVFKVFTTSKFDKNVDALIPFFKQLEVVVLAIPEKFDFYHMLRPKHTDTLDLELGLKAGPNWFFFEAMQSLSKHDTTLCLECDCFFGSSWLSRLYAFTASAGSFWIAGATYAGLMFKYASPTVLNHINGGTGLYATGNCSFQSFLSFSRTVLPAYVESKPDLPYDCFLYSLIEDFFHEDVDNKFIWQFIRQHYVAANLIQNYSSTIDNITSAQSISKRTNYAVLHKKSIEPPAVPVFVHIPKCGGTFFYSQFMRPNLQRAYVQSGYAGLPVSFNLTNKQGKIVLSVITGISKLDQKVSVADSFEMPFDVFCEELDKGNTGPLLGFRIVSWSNFQESLKFIEQHSAGPIECILLLRDPFRREESLFYYLRDVGTWEPTFNEKFQKMTFHEYLQSAHLQPNWLVRRLGSLGDSEIDEKGYRAAIEFVDQCQIVGFQHKYRDFLTEVRARYGYISNPFSYPDNPKWTNRNTTSKKLPITDEMVKLFSSRSHYDVRLYHYCLQKYAPPVS